MKVLISVHGIPQPEIGKEAAGGQMFMYATGEAL